MSKAISLDAAAIVTQVSRRTLWRRLSDSQITRLDNDEEGRTMLSVEDIVPMLCVPMAPEDHELLVKAAGGDADAQNDLALLFLDAEKPEIGLHWLTMAADQSHADAMHNLSGLYIKGIGTQKNNSTGLMWLAKAASMGHVIADQQITALTQARKA